jgi:hypothetical protein
MRVVREVCLAALERTMAGHVNSERPSRRRSPSRVRCDEIEEGVVGAGGDARRVQRRAYIARAA